MNTRYPNTVLFKSEEYHDVDLWLEDYQQWLEDFGLSKGEHRIEEYMSIQESMDWHGLMKCLKESEQGSLDCVITGTLGLWDGKHDIYPVKCNNLCDAILKCVEKADDCLIGLEDGAINVSASHHDGTNTFQIRPISQKGLTSNTPEKYTKKYLGTFGLF